MTKAFLNGAAALLLFLSGCAPASLPPAQSQHAASDLIQEQSVPYQFGVGYSGSGYTQSFEEWRDLVLEDTHGNVELVLYGENVLGEGENMVKAAQRGTLSIAASSTSVCTSIIPEAAILDIPACQIPAKLIHFPVHQFRHSVPVKKSDSARQIVQTFLNRIFPQTVCATFINSKCLYSHK